MERTIFEKSEKNEKFSAGPTLLRPGPILFMQVVTEENVVAKSALLSEMSSNDARKNPR